MSLLWWPCHSNLYEIPTTIRLKIILDLRRQEKSAQDSGQCALSSSKKEAACRKIWTKRLSIRYNLASTAKITESQQASVSHSTVSCTKTTRYGQPRACSNASILGMKNVRSKESESAPRFSRLSIEGHLLRTIERTMALKWATKRSRDLLRNNYWSS